MSIPSFSYINPNDWLDCDTYWLNLSPPLSKTWHDLHYGRPTASKFSSCVGHNQSLCTVDQILTQLSNPYHVPSTNSLMEHGIVTEPEARNWYKTLFNVDVKEVGIAIPKWDIRIGATVDGNVMNTDGIIEIKCPKKMYKPLTDHIHKLSHGWTPSKENIHNHIWVSHYDQMIGNMAVLNKQWCDYVVYCTPENQVYTERIFFDKDYWYSLYSHLTTFIQSKLYPLLTHPIIVPPSSL